jgi:hypothetical protein
MVLLEWLEELLAVLLLRRPRVRWVVYVLIVLAIFVLASFYIVALIRVGQEMSGP